MHYAKRLKTRKRACGLLLAFDSLIFLSVIAVFWAVYYPLPQARLIWKVGLTCNAFVLLFEVRLRLFRCFGYPLQDLKAMGCCCKLTRIRMKLVDLICFFYIFFAQMIHAPVLFTK